MRITMLCLVVTTLSCNRDLKKWNQIENTENLSVNLIGFKFSAFNTNPSLTIDELVDKLHIPDDTTDMNTEMESDSVEVIYPLVDITQTTLDPQTNQVNVVQYKGLQTKEQLLAFADKSMSAWDSLIKLYPSVQEPMGESGIREVLSEAFTQHYYGTFPKFKYPTVEYLQWVKTMYPDWKKIDVEHIPSADFFPIHASYYSLLYEGTIKYQFMLHEGSDGYNDIGVAFVDKKTKKVVGMYLDEHVLSDSKRHEVEACLSNSRWSTEGGDFVLNANGTYTFRTILFHLTQTGKWRVISADEIKLIPMASSQPDDPLKVKIAQLDGCSSFKIGETTYSKD